MPIIDMLKPITDAVEELQTALIELSSITLRNYKLIQLLFVLVIIYPILLLAVYHYVT